MLVQYMHYTEYTPTSFILKPSFSVINVSYSSYPFFDSRLEIIATYFIKIYGALSTIQNPILLLYITNVTIFCFIYYRVSIYTHVLQQCMCSIRMLTQSIERCYKPTAKQELMYELLVRRPRNHADHHLCNNHLVLGLRQITTMGFTNKIPQIHLLFNNDLELSDRIRGYAKHLYSRHHVVLFNNSTHTGLRYTKISNVYQSPYTKRKHNEKNILCIHY